MTATEQLQPSLPVIDPPDAAVSSPAPLALEPLGREASGSGQMPQLRIALPVVISLPVRIDVKIPIPNFRFKDLAGLAEGQVLKTDWSVGEDLAVATGDIRLLWAEFAVADQQLTVRVTRVG